MDHKFKKPLFLLILLTFLPLRIVLADTGPKPSMDFEFKQELPGEQVTITSGTLFECEHSDCSDAKPLMEAGPQRFSCDTTSCFSMSYGYKQYHRIEIQFSDNKARQSNIFETVQFNSKYRVIIRQDDLLVEPKFNLDLFSPTSYILSCTFCLLTVMIIVGAVILIMRRTAKRH
jgi:hypothetical protein